MRQAREIGLLPTLGSFCEHGVVDESCRLPERFYIYMPLGLSDLSKPFWYNNELSLDERLQLLKEPLYGLKTLHGMGYMHRDIRPQNVIVLSYDPPRAALCDFGKTIFASTDRDTAIGPIHTCAPEVWQVRRQGPYDDKIDIWAYGYTIANVLGYACGNNDKITETRWTNIRLYLRNRAKTSSEDRLLIDLALSLLEWEPKKRLTADDALRNECWNTKAAEEVPSSKRIKTACSERIKTTASDVEPTQAFSEETRALIDQKVLHLP